MTSKVNGRIRVQGRLSPAHPGKRMVVTLSRMRNGVWVRLGVRRPLLFGRSDQSGDGFTDSRFATQFPRPSAGPMPGRGQVPRGRRSRAEPSHQALRHAERLRAVVGRASGSACQSLTIGAGRAPVQQAHPQERVMSEVGGEREHAHRRAGAPRDTAAGWRTPASRRRGQRGSAVRRGLASGATLSAVESRRTAGPSSHPLTIRGAHAVALHRWEGETMVSDPARPTTCPNCEQVYDPSRTTYCDKCGERFPWAAALNRHPRASWSRACSSVFGAAVLFAWVGFTLVTAADGFYNMMGWFSFGDGHGGRRGGAAARVNPGRLSGVYPRSSSRSFERGACARSSVDRAGGFGPSGRGFKSCRARHSPHRSSSAA